MEKLEIILNDISDHFLTFACFDLTIQKPDDFFKWTRRVSNDNCVVRFRNKLMNSDWSVLDSLGMVDEMYDSFYEILFRIYDECFHIVTRFKRKKHLTKPYITAEITSI